MIDLEAIRKRNEERNGTCDCSWQNGRLKETTVCPHEHADTVFEDIDTLLSLVDEMTRRVDALEDEIRHGEEG